MYADAHTPNIYIYTAEALTLTPLTGLQTLSYNGYIKIDYTRAIADTKSSIPKKYSTGDELDVKALGDKAMEILSFNMPAGGGFGVGVVAGVRTA